MSGADFDGQCARGGTQLFPNDQRVCTLGRRIGLAEVLQPLHARVGDLERCARPPTEHMDAGAPATVAVPLRLRMSER